MELNVILEREKFDRTAQHVRELPGGDAMCARIAGSLSADPGPRTEQDKHWLEIGISLANCAGFPAHEFAALANAGELAC